MQVTLLESSLELFYLRSHHLIGEPTNQPSYKHLTVSHIFIITNLSLQWQGKEFLAVTIFPPSCRTTTGRLLRACRWIGFSIVRTSHPRKCSSRCSIRTGIFSKARRKSSRFYSSRMCRRQSGAIAGLARTRSYGQLVNCSDSLPVTSALRVDKRLELLRARVVYRYVAGGGKWIRSLWFQVSSSKSTWG